MNTLAERSMDHRGWWPRHRWLVLRRFTQLGVLGLFLLGPLAGWWFIKGNLNGSLTLGYMPLTDPFVLIQSWLAGQNFGSQAFFGAVIIVAFYYLVAGRVYCAWICPLNIVTDVAHWLRQKLSLRGNTRIHRNTRYWILGMSLLLSSVTGVVAWELVNPVSVLHRGLLFGMGAGWIIILAVFLFDLAVSRRGWCGHLCPVGAFYSLLATHSPVRIRALGRDDCNHCMDCFEVCPEPRVIRPALFGAEDGIGPLINEANCTNCGRCIDVCSKQVFSFGLRLGNEAADQPEPDRFDQQTKINFEQFEQKEARL
jgi:ferredoxin-type protein NapH